MLSPNLNETADLFADAFINFKKLDSYVNMVKNTIIGTTKPEPDWLGSFRNRINRLSKECSKWREQKTELRASLFSSFIDYSTTIHGFIKISDEFNDDSDTWIESLNSLKKELDSNAKTAQNAQKIFQEIITEINEIQPLLDESLEDAWADLSSREKEMVDLSSAITNLQDKVASLQDDLSSAEISGGKSYASNIISISYSVITAEGLSDIPFLTVLSQVYTMAKLTYDVISIELEIGPALDKIRDLSTKLSEDAQSLSLTKALIQMTNHYEKTFLQIQKKLPGFQNIWESESDKIHEAVNALKAGADPKTFFDIQTLSVAGETWNVLADKAYAFTRPASESSLLEYKNT